MFVEPLFEYAIKRMSFDECVFASQFELPYLHGVGLNTQLVSTLFRRVDVYRHARSDHECDYDCVRAYESILKTLKFKWRGKPESYRRLLKGFSHWCATHLPHTNLISKNVHTELLLLD